MLAAAKKHTGDLLQDFRLNVITSLNVGGELTEEEIDFEILTEIQHYGGKTNLIDFTTDYFIALFFACDGLYDEDGRVILQKTDEIRVMIAHPRNPRHRVIVQKSVFVRPPKGFIEPREEQIVVVPSYLKQGSLNICGIIMGYLQRLSTMTSKDSLETETFMEMRIHTFIEVLLLKVE